AARPAGHESMDSPPGIEVLAGDLSGVVDPDRRGLSSPRQAEPNPHAVFPQEPASTSAQIVVETDDLTPGIDPVRRRVRGRAGGVDGRQRAFAPQKPVTPEIGPDVEAHDLAACVDSEGLRPLAAGSVDAREGSSLEHEAVSHAIPVDEIADD